MHPRARTTGLVVEELADEVLVYDEERKRAHCLNPVAAAIWRSCNGGRGAAQIRTAAATALGQQIEPGAVRDALDQLGKARLLDVAPRRPRNPGRRALLTGLLIPVVLTIVVKPASAASSQGCINSGHPCGASGGGGTCCPGLKCTADHSTTPPTFSCQPG